MGKNYGVSHRLKATLILKSSFTLFNYICKKITIKFTDRMNRKLRQNVCWNLRLQNSQRFFRNMILNFKKIQITQTDLRSSL